MKRVSREALEEAINDLIVWSDPSTQQKVNKSLDKLYAPPTRVDADWVLQHLGEELGIDIDEDAVTYEACISILLKAMA